MTNIEKISAELEQFKIETAENLENFRLRFLSKKSELQSLLSEIKNVPAEQRKEFWNWISTAEQSQLPEFEKCATTYRHWSKEILNAFKYAHITNGPTEGFNNKIKVLKRTSYGIRNFEHFRTRILLNMH
mgnify:CR=1 FL=1